MVVVKLGSPRQISQALSLGALVNTQDAHGPTSLSYLSKALQDPSKVLNDDDESYLIFCDSARALYILLRAEADPTAHDQCRCTCSPKGCTPITLLLKTGLYFTPSLLHVDGLRKAIECYVALQAFIKAQVRRH